jgi:hypothetical protein
MPFTQSRICILRIISVLAFLVLFATVPLQAQSTDVRFPTPIGSNEIVGAIPARDIGDARLTDHFYTFNGLPGDLLITVESKNLNGDFDVFTAGELRPVLKVVVYAENSSAITKNIYLRKPESLILRVEGRTPNDDEGTYRIRFSGTFAPVEGALVAESQTKDEVNAKPTRSGDRRTTRVSSSGARIDEPPVEVAAAAPTPEPTTSSTVAETAAPKKKAPPVRNSRTGRPVPRRTVPKPSDADTKAAKNTDTPSASENSTTTKPSDVSETSNPTVVETSRPSGKRTTPRSTRATPRTAKPRATAENGKLVLEINDGTRLDYAMSTVSKVTIENGEVVIVTNDGYTRRVPLTTIIRMSIGP